MKEALKIETRSISGKEIARPGDYKASTGDVSITEKTINDFMTNFQNGVYPPYLNLDHNDDFTDEVKKSLNVARLGTISDLYRDDSGALFADFEKVPNKVADFIDSGLMDLRSIEFSKKGSDLEGNEVDNVLRGVSFFGMDTPAIGGLADMIPSLLTIEHKKDDVKVYLKENIKAGGTKKMTVEIDKKEIDRLNKIENDYITLQKDLAEKEIKLKQQDENEVQLKDKDVEIDKLKKDNDELNKLKADHEKEKAELLKKEAVNYVEGLVKTKKLLPKYTDMKVDEYLAVSGDEDKLTNFKEYQESVGEIINFEKMTTKVEEKDDKPVEVTVDNMDEIMEMRSEKIESLMQKDGLTFEEAEVKLGYAKAEPNIRTEVK